MLNIYGQDLETEHRDGDQSARQLGLPYNLPKNRSTGNLALSVDTPDKARFRLSFDAGAAASEYDSIGRSPIMTDHDHGLGRSGLRRIRQHIPMRAPTLPVNSSRNSSGVLMRSVSMVALAPGPVSPMFTEDVNRFSSESLHSFSFAHQSEELLHNRQNVLKRSADFMKDRMGWSAASNASLANAQARAAGDLETQNMFDLLARAQLVNAGNLPNADPENAAMAGPLSGPASLSHESNEAILGSNFPRSASPELMTVTEPNSEQPSPLLMRQTTATDDYYTLSPLQGSPVVGPVGPAAGRPYEKMDAVRLPSAAGLSLLPPESASAESSRTPTTESGTTQKTSPPSSRHPSLMLKRSMTDTSSVAVQQRLFDTMARPYVSSSADPLSMAQGLHGEHLYEGAGSPSLGLQPLSSPLNGSANLGSSVHSHTSRWVPAAQAIFTTEAKPPWTIIAANDLACLVFGVTKAEVRKMGILEVVQEERRAWLEKKLLHGDADDVDGTGASASASASNGKYSRAASAATLKTPSSNTNIVGSRSGGLTAKLLSKPSSRTQTPTPPSSLQSPQLLAQGQKPSLPARRANTIHSGDAKPPKPSGGHHHANNSRGVLLCGDVVPIQKRNGATGAASLWVKEKRIGLIWVLEEIHEDVATITLNEDGLVAGISGDLGPIWGDEMLQPGIDIGKLMPRIPRKDRDTWIGPVDLAEVAKHRYYTCRNCDRINIPATVERVSEQPALRVSSFPHIAGIIVVSTQALTIKSSNSVFAGALFGYEKPNGHPITQLIPDFDKILQILIDVDNIHMVDGMVVPEHSFRKAAAFLALREGRPDAGAAFLRPEGLPARHRDGSELRIDVQMRVVQSEHAQHTTIQEETVLEEDDEDAESTAESTTTSGFSLSTQSVASTNYTVRKSEMVYALWITYSRHLHATRQNLGMASPLLSGLATPLHQPSPGQTPIHSPQELSPGPASDRRRIASVIPGQRERTPTIQVLAQQLHDMAEKAGPKDRLPSLSQSQGDAAGTEQENKRPAGAGAASASALALVSGDGLPKATATTAATAVETTVEETLKTSDTSEPKMTETKTPSDVVTTAVATTVTTEKEITTDTETKTTTETPATTDTDLGHKKTIDDFVIVEEMGQGAYGQVKLAKYKATGRKVVLKYVTKRRILMDTWTRDRRLGTVPLEIHVLDYLRRDGLQHPNIVEMEDFFEDDVNYYIEMVPHGLPGMDLFDYIELRRNMEEQECRSIFVQVAQAIHHLHTKAMVVHRDIKDENVVLDGDGHIRLIDFGSAAYIKSGPFDVFVGTIDYAAPEVLAGRPYGGKEQDVWALGILLYTIIYKENPFYSIDEIMDRDLRVPYTISEESIDLIRHMLDRDVAQRFTIEQVLAHPWCEMEEE